MISAMFETLDAVPLETWALVYRSVAVATMALGAVLIVVVVHGLNSEWRRQRASRR